MATIFTVHGTLATGPEHGNQWWQKGGILDRELRSCVVADDGEIELRPVIWDGANSERSRREAATRLLSKTKEEEKVGKQYVLIGHSHGGSVMLNAVIQGASRDFLPRLASVITVATPFIHFRKSRFLFNRVSVAWKAILLTLLSFPVIILQLFLYWDNMWFLPELVSFLLLPFLVCYLILLAFDLKRQRRYRSGVRKECQARLGRIWHCLHDRNDEAVCGLRSVHNMKPNIFPSGFGVGLLSTISIFAIPTIIWLDIHGGSRVIATKLWRIAAERFFPVSSVQDIIAYFHIHALFVLLLLLPLSLWAVMAATISAAGISRIFVPLFDVITWNTIKNSLFGADTIGERGYQATHHPEWMDVGFKPLPPDLSKEINDFSDAEAAKSIPKLRSAIADLASLYNVADPNKSVAQYLTWNELVHTSYFAIPRFRKLVYYIIANSEGFKPTPAFLNDPDYKLVEQWYQEIQPQADGGM